MAFGKTPAVPTDPKTLDLDELRDDLLRTCFTGHSGPELFGMEVETFPFRWGADCGPPCAVGLDPGRCDDAGLLERVAKYTDGCRVAVVRPGDPAPEPCEDRVGTFTFEPGGQVEFSCSPGTTPTQAYEYTATVLDGLQLTLEEAGIHTISLGANPWQTPEEIGLQTSAARYVCMDQFFASIGEYGAHMMRRTAAAHCNLDLGQGTRGPLRWQAAQLLAPIALLTFSCSPMVGGRPSGDRNSRGRSWLHLDPSRSGFPAGFLEDPTGEPHRQFLDFALDARVLLMRRPAGWLPMTRPLTFRAWMENGFDGDYPGLDDWHYHLSTLFPEVRPKGFLEVRSADAQARPFRAVPLAWWTCLLCDDAALARIVERLRPTADSLQQRMRVVVESGFSDPDLAADARFAWGLAADAMLRVPKNWFSREMQSAFVVFGERFTLRDRAPGDEMIDRFLAEGVFGPDQWVGLEEEWSAAVGLPSPQERRALGQGGCA